MEDFAEGVAKGAFRLVSLFVRSVVWLIMELAFDCLAWYAGWPVCRTLTLGHWPEEPIHQFRQAPLFRHFVVSMVGLVSLVALGTVLARLAG